MEQLHIAGIQQDHVDMSNHASISKVMYNREWDVAEMWLHVYRWRGKMVSTFDYSDVG